ncbi:MAG: hypothetical protein ABS960_06525, partial [Solibacillus isronensis]
KTEYPYDDFLLIVLIEIDALIKRNGFIGYREKWYDFDFPLTTFLKLKKYIVQKQNYPIQEVQGTLSPSTQIEHFLLIKDEHFLFVKYFLLMF